MGLTAQQKAELNRVCGKLEGMSIGLTFADMFNSTGLQEALNECKAQIEKVLADPGEPVEELLKGVK